MSDYFDTMERTIKHLEAQIEHAIYTGEKFKQGQLEKQLEELQKARDKKHPPEDCF